jgi:hypothetical protein
MTKEQKIQAKNIRDEKFEDQEAKWLHKEMYGDTIEMIQEPDSGSNQAEVIQEQKVIMKLIQERPRSNSRSWTISKEGSSNKNLPLVPKVVVHNPNNISKTNMQTNNMSLINNLLPDFNKEERDLIIDQDQDLEDKEANLDSVLMIEDQIQDLVSKIATE